MTVEREPSRRRLLAICHGYPPYYGGAEHIAYYLAREAARTGRFDVSVLTSDLGGRLAPREESEGVHVRRVPAPKREWTRHTALELGLFWRSASRRLGPLADEIRPDVVLAHFSFPAGVLARQLNRARGVPYLVGLYGSDVPGYQPRRFGLAYPFLKPVVRRVWRDAAHVIAMSPALRDLAYATWPGGRIEIIPGGVDAALFRPLEEGKGTSSRDRMTIAVAAQLIERKGIHHLLEAVAALDPSLRAQVKVEICGTGPFEPVLRARTSALGLADSVRFHGLLPRESLPALLWRADVFVLPSLSEAFGIALLEAMACGAAVVATRVGGIESVVTDGVDGLLVEPGQPSELSAALARLLGDEGLRRSLGAAARRTAERYAWGHIWRRYEALLEPAVGPLSEGQVRHRAAHRAAGTEGRRAGKALTMGRDAVRRSLLVICQGYPPYYGGAEYAAHYLAREAARSGRFDVTVLTSDLGGRLEEHGENEGVHVIRVPAPKREWTRHTAFEIGHFWMSARRRLAALADGIRPDVVFAHFSFPAGLLARRLRRTRGVPYVVVLHGSDVPGYQPQRFWAAYPFLKPIVRRVWRDAEHVVAVSDALRDLAHATWPGGRIDVIPGGVDTSFFQPLGKGAGPFSKGWKTIVVAGQLIERKGIHYLLEAVAALEPDVRAGVKVEISGRGPLEPALRADVAAMGLSDTVRFHGLLPREQFASFMGSADVFILPSLQEGLPQSVLEAMACGTAVVATRVGGIPSVITDGQNGLLVEPGQPSELSAALARLLGDEGLRRSLGAAARRTAERYAWGHIWRRYEALLEPVCAPRMVPQPVTEAGRAEGAPGVRAVAAGRGPVLRRLLMICQGFPPYYGGAEHAAYYLTREAARADGLDVAVVASDLGGRLPAEEAMDGFRVFRVRARKREWTRHTVPELLSFHAAARRFLPGLIQRWRPDLVLAHFSVPAGDLARRMKQQFGIPYATVLQGSDVPGYQPQRFWAAYPLMKPVVRRVWREAAHVIAVSKGLKDLALKTWPDGRVTVIENGVDTDLFEPLERQGGTSSKGWKKVVVVAQLIERKGIHYLLEAVAGLEAADRERLGVDVYGTGPYETRLRALAAHHGLTSHVRFHGLVKHDEFPAILGSADIFVLPSLQEGLPLSLLEAMAAGLPVVTTRAGGIGEVVRDRENGLLVDAQDADQLKDALLTLLRDEPLGRRLAEAARRTAAGYSWARVWQRYAELLGV